MKWFVLLIAFVGAIFYLVMTKGSEPMVGTGPSKKEQELEKALHPPEPPPPPPPPTLEERLTPGTLDSMRALTEDQNPSVRNSAIELLYKLKDPEIMKVIVKAAGNDSEPETQGFVLNLLRSDRSPKSLAILLQAARSTNKSVRVTAVNILGEFGNEQALPVLTRAMKDLEPEVQQAAIRSIDQVQAEVERRRIEEYQRKALEEMERKAKEAEELKKKAKEAK